MKKVAKKKDLLVKVEIGKVEILEDFQKHLFLARPHGIVNPTLLKEDLNKARAFAKKCPDLWSYVTNTEDVRLVNPFNLLYLKEIKKLKKLKQIVIYAPGMINRLLIRMTFFIIKPDKIIKNRKHFQLFLENLC